MKKILAVAAVLLLATSISTADESDQAAVSVVQTNIADIGPGHVTIEGPSTAEVGKTVSLVVRGLPEIDLDQTMLEELAWIKAIRIVLDSPEGVDATIDDEFVITSNPFSWRQRIMFIPPEPGTYLVVYDWNTPPYGLARHRVEVRGPPDPTPGPGPKPGPGPGPIPGPNPYPVPSQSIQDATAAIQSIQISRDHATSLAKLYNDAARLVESAPAAIAAGTRPEIATTADLRQWLVTSGQELGIQGQYAGLADAVDRFLGQQLGTAVRNVTGNDATTLRGLAWGAWEAGTQ